jgi:hypothetical protein
MPEESSGKGGNRKAKPIQTTPAIVGPKKCEDSQREAEDGKGSRIRKKLGPHRYRVMHRLIDYACLDRGWRALDLWLSKRKNNMWDWPLVASVGRDGRCQTC